MGIRDYYAGFAAVNGEGAEEIERRACSARASMYNKFYQLYDSGKKEKAMQELAQLQKYSAFRGSYCCPRCGAALLISDMPKKDYVCLPCMRYYYEEDLQDLQERIREETNEEKIKQITEEFIRILDSTNNAAI